MTITTGVQNYINLVRNPAVTWTRNFDRLSPEQQQLVPQSKDVWTTYGYLTQFVTPELINVVNGEAIWRIPFSGNTDLLTTYLTETVAATLDPLSGERWKFFAIGRERNEGDLFHKGQLSRSEINQLQQRRFPRSLKMYGVPRPGVCGSSHGGPGRGAGHAAHPPRGSHGPPRNNHGTYTGPRGGPSRGFAEPEDDFGYGHAPHPPRQPHGPRGGRRGGHPSGPPGPRGGQRGQRGPPHGPPRSPGVHGPPGRGHGHQSNHQTSSRGPPRNHPPPRADSPDSSISSDTETTATDSSASDSSTDERRRGRRRRAQGLGIAMAGMAALALGGDGEDDGPRGSPARGAGARGPGGGGGGRRSPLGGRDGGGRRAQGGRRW
ncbi:MAG: hypothetical protein L6R41_006678 [Letrouitia leprolyta]|nr:MAG: hypothetical protein L6R41_006678 [Letrouitia leprolyta]